MVRYCSALASRSVGEGVFCPNGEIPPTTYPVRRSAIFGSHMEALFQPRACAAAFRFSCPLTGTTATAKSLSCTIRSVLNTCSGSAPSFCAASSPKEVSPSACSYSRISKGVSVSFKSATAAVDAPFLPPLFFLAIGTILRKREGRPLRHVLPPPV